MTDAPEIGYYVSKKNDIYKQAEILETLASHAVQSDTKIMAQGLTTLVKGQLLTNELQIEILKTLELLRTQ